MSEDDRVSQMLGGSVIDGGHPIRPVTLGLYPAKQMIEHSGPAW